MNGGSDQVVEEMVKKKKNPHSISFVSLCILGQFPSYIYNNAIHFHLSFTSFHSTTLW